MVEETDVVNEDLTNPTETESEQIEEVVLEEATPAPGSKTDPALLLQALKEEREKTREEKRKRLEAEEKLSSSAPDVGYEPSTEGIALRNEIKALESKLSDVLGNSVRQDVLNEYPQLKDKWAEFEEFRSDDDNKGMSLKTSAKAFLVENGLFTARRKGLEKPTGGDKTPKPTGLTPEEVENIRKNDGRRYKKLLAEGAFDKMGN